MSDNLTMRLSAEGDALDALMPDTKRGGFITVGQALRALSRRFGDETIVEDESKNALETVPTKFVDQAKGAIERGLTKCESPIEKAILPWLVTQWYQFFDYNPAVLFAGEQGLYVPRTLAIVPQLPIGRFRPDFALAGSLGGPIGFVLVECDGKEHHDGVENVVRDLNRDVILLKNPRVLSIIRLSGVEISADPRAAAKVAARVVLESWAKKPPVGRRG